MRPDRPRAPVAIVGGGFSGTMLAAQLARRGIASVLMEGGGRAGQGAAYSTDEPAHVLNVRAEGMSAWPEQPGDFADRFGDPRGFAERRFFGRYLRAILDDALATGLVELVERKAVAAAPSDVGWELALDNGGKLGAKAVGLAIGNQPPEPFGAAAGARFIDDPWSEKAKAAVRGAAAGGGDVLLVGTGLTMVDAVLSLAAAGHRGRIVAVSRRGQVPKAHGDFQAAPVALSELPSGDLLKLWRWLRRRSGEAGWRAAVDSLRPHSHALWQSLGADDQRRFLRHARPWWDVHRHRIAPEVARQVHSLVAEGRLEIIAGRIGEMRGTADALEVQIRKRGGGRTMSSRRFAFVLNCTGPLGTIRSSRNPILRQMLDDGLVRPDHLGIGLEVDSRSRCAGSERLWALGPLTKGRYWEIVAVPDIREQAAAVAEDIARELQA